MLLSKNKLYLLLTIACIAGYSWLYFNTISTQAQNSGVEVCLIKHLTNIPCPSCGSTRSVVSLINGNFLDALYLNPFGLIIAFILLVVPIWILTDILMKRSSLYNAYRRMELLIKKPQFSIPLVTLVLINWIWNISKGL